MPPPVASTRRVIAVGSHAARLRLAAAGDVGREARLRGCRGAGGEHDARRGLGARPGRRPVGRQRGAVLVEQLDGGQAADEARGRARVREGQEVADLARSGAAGDQREAAAEVSARAGAGRARRSASSVGVAGWAPVDRDGARPGHRHRDRRLRPAAAGRAERQENRAGDDGAGHAPFGERQGRSSASSSHARTPPIGSRSCASESRSRTVTVSSASVCSSTVNAQGVPISSWRR